MTDIRKALEVASHALAGATNWDRCTGGDCCDVCRAIEIVDDALATLPGPSSEKQSWDERFVLDMVEHAMHIHEAGTVGLDVAKRDECKLCGHDIRHPIHAPALSITGLLPGPREQPKRAGAGVGVARSRWPEIKAVLDQIESICWEPVGDGE